MEKSTWKINAVGLTLDSLVFGLFYAAQVNALTCNSTIHASTELKIHSF